MKKLKAHVWQKEKDGHYVEPSWCSRRLFEVEMFSGHIYDPCCGWGTITTEAQAAGYSVSGSDIVNRRRHHLGTRFVKRDFLMWFDYIDSSVVCNPPFDYVQEFCEHALNMQADKVAVICLVRRLNAAHWLRELPLQTVYLLTPRPSMPPGSWIAAGNKPGGGTQDFCWLVFQPRYNGSPLLKWLHRDGKEGTRE